MKPVTAQRIRVIDSHTEGEPTRVVVSGVSGIEGATMAEKRENFRRDWDWLRSAVVCEPRGNEAMVGAMLCDPVEPDCVTGVIFFNNVGVLHGCLHATMGVAVTLTHLGRIGPGTHRFDTSTGVIDVMVSENGRVTVGNIRSYRFETGIPVEIPGYGVITGDVAWGGNWFFIAETPPGLRVDSSNIEELTKLSRMVRQGLESRGITGADAAEIDHIEFTVPSQDPLEADGRNFVLCPGNAYDRSPCGTGTSAKLACLYESGRLKAGDVWRQAGILGTVFEGTVKPASQGGVHPSITGNAYITAEADLLINPSDLFAFGIPSPVSNTTP